jgi:hypothetical protein
LIIKNFRWGRNILEKKQNVQSKDSLAKILMQIGDFLKDWYLKRILNHSKYLEPLF